MAITLARLWALPDTSRSSPARSGHMLWLWSKPNHRQFQTFQSEVVARKHVVFPDFIDTDMFSTAEAWDWQERSRKIMWCVMIWTQCSIFVYTFPVVVHLFMYVSVYGTSFDLNVETQLQVLWSSKGIREVSSHCLVFYGRESMYGAWFHCQPAKQAQLGVVKTFKISLKISSKTLTISSSELFWRTSLLLVHSVWTCPSPSKPSWSWGPA